MTETVPLATAVSAQPLQEFFLTRVAGALLLVAGSTGWLIGDRKVAVELNELGLAATGNVEHGPVVPVTSLDGQAAIPVRQLALRLFAASGAEVAERLKEYFLIRRNGLVSERLWRLATDSSLPEATSLEGGDVRDAAWLMTIPAPVWEAVRETVLKC